MSDEERQGEQVMVPCLVCGGDGFIETDDGSEQQCEACDGAGVVPPEGEPASRVATA